MAKFEAKDCANFEGMDAATVKDIKDGRTVHVCTQVRCLDRNDCDTVVRIEAPVIRFVPNEPPPTEPGGI